MPAHKTAQPVLSPAEWKLVEHMARDLAQKRVSQNLVRQALAYTQRSPGVGPLRGWLRRLVELGAAFASGREDVTRQERENLRAVLDPALKANPESDWPLLLGWTSRLMLAYAPQKAEAPDARRRR